MEYYTIARVIHVLAIVLWIGGVAMVTMVILPAVKRMKFKENKIDIFENLEGRFSIGAKIYTLLTGISGFYMIDVLNAWHRFLEIRYWWVTAMLLVWVLFSVVLFILEPFVLGKLYKKYAAQDANKTFAFIQRFHWVLLTISLITIIGAVAGSHGLFFIP